MKCYRHQLSFAVAIGATLFYIAGALALSFFPQTMAPLFASLCYLSSNAFMLEITWSSFLSGLLQSFIYTYLYAWLVSSLYYHMVPEF